MVSTFIVFFNQIMHLVNCSNLQRAAALSFQLRGALQPDGFPLTGGVKTQMTPTWRKNNVRNLCFLLWVSLAGGAAPLLCPLWD